MSDHRETFKTTISEVGGMIFISLPDNQYIELTPDKARTIAGKLFALAAQAEGDDPPKLIMFETREPAANIHAGSRVRGGGAGA